MADQPGSNQARPTLGGKPLLEMPEKVEYKPIQLDWGHWMMDPTGEWDGNTTVFRLDDLGLADPSRLESPRDEPDAHKLERLNALSVDIQTQLTLTEDVEARMLARIHEHMWEAKPLEDQINYYKKSLHDYDYEVSRCYVLGQNPGATKKAKDTIDQRYKEYDRLRRAAAREYEKNRRRLERETAVLQERVRRNYGPLRFNFTRRKQLFELHRRALYQLARLKQLPTDEFYGQDLRELNDPNFTVDKTDREYITDEED